MQRTDFNHYLFDLFVAFSIVYHMLPQILWCFPEFYDAIFLLLLLLHFWLLVLVFFFVGLCHPPLKHSHSNYSSLPVHSCFKSISRTSASFEWITNTGTCLSGSTRKMQPCPLMAQARPGHKAPENWIAPPFIPLQAPLSSDTAHSAAQWPPLTVQCFPLSWRFLGPSWSHSLRKFNLKMEKE